jgi:hypothetical protein
MTTRDSALTNNDSLAVALQVEVVAVHVTEAKLAVNWYPESALQWVNGTNGFAGPGPVNGFRADNFGASR